jgi:hypothetical protein
MAKKKPAAKRPTGRRRAAAKRASPRKRAAKRAPRGAPPADRRGATYREDPGDKHTVAIETFFKAVAGGLVTAQKELDGESLKYLAHAADHAHVLPGVFRIPKLSADISFAVEEVEEDKFSLIFFGDSTRAETRHQQSVHFDIVSVPPPPEFQQSPFRLVLERAQRARVVEEAAKIPARWPDAAAEDVLVFRLFDDHYVVAYAGERRGELLIIYVHMAGETPAKVVIREMKRDNPPALNPLHDALRELARQQRGLFPGA